jgi:hypothetical protein
MAQMYDMPSHASRRRGAEAAHPVEIAGMSPTGLT